MFSKTIRAFLMGLAFTLPVLAQAETPTPVETPAKDITVIVDDQPLAVPEDFQKTLQDLGVQGLILVDGQNRVRVVGPDGTPKDLCGPAPADGAAGPRDCKLITSAGDLLTTAGKAPAAAASNCGHCQNSARALGRVLN
jgi:hypothetical protein